MWAALVAALLMTLGLQTASAADGTGATGARASGAGAADQVLTWTAGNDIDRYLSAPATAVAGPATIVFENSAATGNTTGMPHTLTFMTSDPEFNSDVQLNILANPGDAQGGRHTAEVTLTPGRYLYYCTIPGHGQMRGVLTVTEGGGEDTTAPEATAKVTGTRNAEGAYVGSASVAVEATDEGSGVDRIEYAIGDDGAWQPYTAPVVVDRVGTHTVRYRALDRAGNVSAEKSVEFTVVAPPSDDTAPPDTSATVDGERNGDGAYIDMATVTVTASDTGSGVNTIEYAIGADGAWQPYTGPVMVHRTGTHTVRYRATDRAGNVSAEKSVEFTVVAAPPQDTTPPVTGATVTGTKNSDGAYVGNARVTVSATDEGGSGVAGIEYSLDGGPYLAYTQPVVVDRAGRHTVAYRASDKAGNTSQALTVSFTVVAGGGVPAPNCPEYDERLTVIVGTVDSGVPNRVTNNRCRIGELIEDEKEWTSQALFLKHVRTVLDGLQKEGVVDEREHRAVDRAARQSGIGRPGQTEGYRTILDGSPESFARWQHVGGGSFALNPDGSITSGTTRGGLGMLWFPERTYGDFSLKLQWRDDAPGTGNANSGVFVRFPQIHDHPEESRPEWVAIKYGHEVQVFDSPTGDMYKTGSVYGFDRVGLAGAGVTQKGTWNDYEIRVVDQHYSVYRNGVLINEFDNIGGQDFSPPRSDDPGTDGRRFASGYVGLQVHGTTDVVSYRDVRIKELP
ncbi:OmpL47-type beta-barrel domain-containing protein (plasmid) [Streptomyces viridosporus]|uniref:Glycosyl hydrolase n=1 Tax=Streptomyces viridosporus (strain ATCC 14672 / DSM 40746 / JCM 4963 / KCTC 9882 / NRRL B-12104 / FH 1290) TaxID=566461 RepID=D6A335_STRV1|nr:family 16 glycoside hydrolase [Streptomyces viridosporus]EFE65710.1 glycosyl hydrolase [Streptomyces viridosporus ATCC 14672]